MPSPASVLGNKLKPLCTLGELGAFLGELTKRNTHHGDTEHTEDAQRRTRVEFPDGHRGLIFGVYIDRASAIPI